MAVTAYVALGSNLGDRQAHLNEAAHLLRETPGVDAVRTSSFHDTAPVGGPPGQGRYLNAVAELRTDLPPQDLLRHLLAVEQKLGRVRREKDGPRTLDLDLLLYGDAVVDEPGLQVPHPRLHLRSFVLDPLAELAPDLVHPTLGRTVAELRRSLGAQPSAPPGRELTGLRALVTGSTSGIGRAVALAFAAGGAAVLVHGRRADAADRVRQEVESHGIPSGVVLGDLRDRDRLPLLVEEAWSRWGGLDVWVNNAGADTLTGEAARWPFDEKLRALLDIDVVATMTLSREAGGRMRAAGGGVLLNVGWDQAATGMEGDSGQLFAAAKGAVMAFSKSLALSLAPEVRVNCLAPGWIRTAWGDQASDHWQERVRRETPLRRWGTPEDVAAAARWLASPAAAFLTGQTVCVNGGVVRL